MKSNLKCYSGGCHCKRIQFECFAPQSLIVWKCNCSICWMKQNHHFIIPNQHFKLISGEEYISSYFFNTKQAKHMFCKICGVESFYQPRSNPDGIGINIYCVQVPKDTNIEFKSYDGQNWEEFYEQNQQIQMQSKLN